MGRVQGQATGALWSDPDEGWEAARGGPDVALLKCMRAVEGAHGDYENGQL